MPPARLSCLAAALAAFSLAGCKPQNDTDARLATPRVLVAQVRLADATAHSYTGLITARVQSDLGFRVQGKVVERLVDTGQVVQQGQPLMRIDPTDYGHAVTVQIGDVAAARARWMQAASDEKRYRGLVASGAISKITYDQAKEAADSAQALLAAAQAQEKVARNQNDYAVLVADADGTVVDTLAEPGQVVTAGQTVVQLAHAGPREASVDLPETERPALGSAAEARLYGGTVTVAAHLRQLSDAADPRTRTYEARYVLDGTGARAPLGATVTISLADVQPEGAQAARTQVPLAALDDEGRGPGIWVIDPASFHIAYRPVQVAQFGAETAVLSSGARPGEQIVASGGHFLHEGETVQAVGSQAAMQ